MDVKNRGVKTLLPKSIKQSLLGHPIALANYIDYMVMLIICL